MQVRGDQKEVIHQSHQRATQRGKDKWIRLPPAVAQVLLQPQRLWGEMHNIVCTLSYLWCPWIGRSPSVHSRDSRADWTQQTPEEPLCTVCMFWEHKINYKYFLLQCPMKVHSRTEKKFSLFFYIIRDSDCSFYCLSNLLLSKLNHTAHQHLSKELQCIFSL